MPAVLVLRGLRQEESESEASLQNSETLLHTNRPRVTARSMQLEAWEAWVLVIPRATIPTVSA